LNADGSFLNKTAPDANNSGGSNPKAYLTVVFFNERFEYASEGSTYLRVAAAGDGQAPLVIPNVKAPKNGYAYVYLSNESNEPVYFDDFKVADTRGRIIEEDHYYAFGLRIDGISSKKLDVGLEGSLKNNNLYNDKELFDDADLDWYDYGYRNYDPQIGRFPQLDPLTDDYPELTPFQYASDEPIANVDIDGLEGGSAIADFSYTYTKSATNLILPAVSQVNNAVKTSSIIFNIAKAAIPKIVEIAETHSEQSIVKRQLQANMQAQLSSPSSRQNATINSCCSYFVSDLQKSINATNTSNAGYNPDGSVNFLSRIALNRTWNKFANNIVFSPAVDIAGAAVGISELSEGLRLMESAEMGVEYTKSSLSVGRQMHSLYKKGVADNITTFKEFTGISGIRPDFVDFNTRTIYELKPYNPRSIKAGINQLDNYQKMFQKKYGGQWKIVLDTY
jgi:RHS repeat-associated protein